MVMNAPTCLKLCLAALCLPTGEAFAGVSGVARARTQPLARRGAPLSVGWGRPEPTPPTPLPPPPPPFFNSQTRPPLRVAAVAALWTALLAYVTLLAPGHDAAAQAKDLELVQAIIANPFDPDGVPFLTVVFNYMGIWPAWYAATLLPGAQGQKPLPAGPFVGASLAAGMFALSPYLALRERRPVVDPADSDTALGRWLEGRLNAALLMAGAVGLTAYGFSAHGGDVGASFAEYADLFQTQLFVNVMSLDFLALWALSPWVMAEDMERRGVAFPGASLPAALPWACVPLLGHCAYLLTRPPLAPNANAADEV